MERLLRVFDELMKCKTTREVDGLLVGHNISNSFYFSEETYPKIPFKISQEEIIELREKGVLADDYTILDISGFSAIEKLLYSLIWKNGDLKKLKHIVAGVLAQSEDSADQGIVFHQYGKFLSGKPNEPIIDQHVLRAFAVYEFRGNSTVVDRYKKLEVITKKEIGLIARYKQWLSEKLTFELRQDPEYTYHVDKVLFALGKYIKFKNRRNRFTEDD